MTMLQHQFLIKSLELTDFMKFKHRVFNFAEDLTVVVGANGSGKSSILEALALSFQVKDRGNSVNQYIRHGKDTASIKLVCDWLEKELTIESTFSTKGRRIHRVVSYNGAFYEDTKANNFLLEFFDFRTLTIAFALQGNEKFLTTSRATNLKNLINLLQLDFNKELVFTKTKIQAYAKDKDQSLSNLNKLQGAKDVLKSNHDQYETKIKDFEAQLKSCENINVEDLKTFEEKIFSLKEDLQKLLKLKESSDINFKNWQNAKNKLDTDVNELSVTNNQLSNLVIKDIQDTTEKEKVINDLDQTISTLQNSLKTCFQQASEVNSNLATLKANKGFELDRKQKIANGICPTCLQKVSTAATTDLETKIQQITAEIEHLEKKLQEIEISKKDIDADITVKQSQQQQEKQELVSIQKENTNIEHNIELKSVLEKNVVNLQKAIEAEKATADNLEAVYKDSVEDRSVEIVELQNNLNNFENQKSEVLQKQNLKSIAEANLVDCKNHLQLLSADIEKNAKDVQQAEQTLKAIEKGTADWSKVQEAFNLIPKLHLKTFLDDIETVCSSIATRFGYKGILIDSDEKGIEFFLQDWPLADVESADTPYEMCSGFEKNLVNLSLVYALSRMFRVPFVCIDELDASADTENTAKLGELVKLILQYTPVVTVSHDNNLISDLLQSNYKVSILKTIEEKQ